MASGLKATTDARLWIYEAGILAMKVGQRSVALELFRISDDLEPDNPVIWNPQNETLFDEDQTPI